ncbi:MAG TPA: ABC transporter [Alphaproteobacteria bacterium]|nr:ABC transporter [Alphaproteobacteria bacterium]
MVRTAILAAGLLLAAGAALANPLLPGATPEGLGPLPGPLGDLVAWINGLQRSLHRGLTVDAGAVRDGGGLAAIASLIGLSFVYGVVHAAGPGHGKAVVSSYFLGRDARWSRGAAAAGLVAGVQALTGILAVGLLAALFGFRQVEVMRHATLLETVSFGLIVALGLVMVWGALTGREIHLHSHAHDRAHGGAGDWRGLFGMALAVGIRPCTGGLLVLLFCLANGIFLVGVAANLAMGLGVAISLCLIGFAGIGARRAVLHFAGERHGHTHHAACGHDHHDHHHDHHHHGHGHDDAHHHHHGGVAARVLRGVAGLLIAAVGALFLLASATA